MTSSTPPLGRNQTENRKPQDEPRPSGSEALFDQLSQSEFISEDTAELIAQNWQKVVGFAGIILLSVWVWGQYKQSGDKKQADAAAKFASVQKSYASVLQASAEGDKPAQDELTKFEDSSKIIKGNYSSSIYSDLSDLYLAAKHTLLGEPSQSQESLKPYLDEHLLAGSAARSSDELSAEQLVKELAALIHIRSQLTEENSDLGEIRKQISALARSSRVVSVEAIASLFNISSTEQEREDAKKVAREVISNNPELANLIEAELARNAVKL